MFSANVERRKLKAAEDSVTVTLNLNPEIEAGLLAKAQAQGMDVQEYVRALVEREALPARKTAISEPPIARQEAVRRMLDFGDKHHLSLGEPITRELLHEGHRF